MDKIDEGMKARLLEMIGELNLEETEMSRIKTEKRLERRLMEMQSIYESKRAIRDEASKAYNASKLTMTAIIDEAASFSRPTLYGDPLLKKYAEFLVKKSNENDASEKMQKALIDRQDIESYNEALVRDIIELMHIKEECTLLKGKAERQAQRIAELEAKLGVKSNVIPMERRVENPPKKLEGVFPVDLYRD